jgi:hypothetical protein
MLDAPNLRMVASCARDGLSIEQEWIQAGSGGININTYVEDFASSGRKIGSAFEQRASIWSDYTTGDAVGQRCGRDEFYSQHLGRRPPSNELLGYDANLFETGYAW